jgi:superfamily II DNA or RNA helicase
MSVLVDIESIPLEQRKIMTRDLSVKTMVKKGKKQKYPVAHNFDVYEVLEDDKVTIPFSYYFQNIGPGFPNADKVFPRMSPEAKFKVPLFDRQKDIRDETLSILNQSRSIVLSLFTGFGKTCFALYLACKIGLKTVIYAHRLIIVDQWGRAIAKTTWDGDEAVEKWREIALDACPGAKIQVVGAKTEIDPEADFYIINVTNVPKRGRTDFAHCGVLIVDEAHVICAEKFSAALRWAFPRYVLFLTATPVRSDGKDRVIELYAGPNIIYRPLRALFNVYLLPTGFKPDPKAIKTEGGDLNWNAVLDQQARSRRRNELIVDVVRYFAHRNILIACKRKSHADLLVAALTACGEDVDSYMGSDEIVNYDCRILVVTYSKGGVGFDHPKLDMLIPAGDAEENWIQYLGRVFRREWHFPVIVDPVDKFFSLKKHADSRIEIYKESGGEVKNLDRWFPCFEAWRRIFATDISGAYEELGIEDVD